MNKSAILHIPLSQYAFANSEKTLTIRLRTGKKDLTSCTLLYGDRACNCTPVQFFPLPMNVIAEDEYFDYYEATFESPFTRVCYYFKLEKQEEWTYYYANQFTKDLPDLHMEGKIIEGRSEYYQYPFMLRSELSDVPNWFKDAIVYNIFPDSFASGKKSLISEKKIVNLENQLVSQSRLGGTIKGITENLDYIEELGFNCIYLNPIFVAGEYHKYDILDYYHIDPCLGSDQDFKVLVDEIHKRKMKIIIDGVFNHTSWNFFAFNDVVEQGESSKYKDWFYDLEFPVTRPENQNEIPTYACFAYERKMPKLDTSNIEVQEYFAQVGKYWIKEYHVDGWRLDVANEIDRNFWRKFRIETKKANAECVLIGEVWENAETWLRGDAFDSTMNYDFRNHCRDFFALKTLDSKMFANRINQMQLRYPKNIALGQLNLLDSHDVPRFLSMCKEDGNQWKMAFIFLMLSSGVPSLFYGDENGISGISENEYRSPMPWNMINNRLVEFVKRVISIRKDYTDYNSEMKIDINNQGSGVFSFARIGKKGNISISLNGGLVQEKIMRMNYKKVLLEDGVEGDLIQPNGYGIYLL